MKYRCEIADGVDITEPLIYAWEIISASGEVLCHYVGKAKNGAERPLRYKLRVVKWIDGVPSKKPPRKIHLHLAQAVREKYEIRLTLLQNVPLGGDINAAERRWKSVFRSRSRPCEEVALDAAAK